MSPAPPTIAHLKGRGLKGLFVTCGNAACQHSMAFTFDALGVADDVLSPTGGRAVNVMPDWRMHNAAGTGHCSEPALRVCALLEISQFWVVSQCENDRARK
jgi:hypothetical protein